MEVSNIVVKSSNSVVVERAADNNGRRLFGVRRPRVAGAARE